MTRRIQISHSFVDGYLEDTIWGCSYLPVGIIAYWVDSDFNIRDVLIALPPMEGQHTWANIATIAFKVIENYQISGKLGYGMLDSASNNDIIIAAL